MPSQKDDTKTSIISRELAAYRVGNPCPTCGDHLVIKLPRFHEDPESGRVTYNGHYGVCAGHPDDTDHYQLSPGGGENSAKPRETTGSPVPRQFRTDIQFGPPTASSSGPRRVWSRWFVVDLLLRLAVQHDRLKR